jgi:uncharacterized protein (TIGR01244 family)
MRQLDDSMFVAGQIRPEEVPGLAGQGVTAIVNNRPDGEEPGQPAGAEIAAAAEAAGIAYRHIPIAGGFNLDDVLAMAAALDDAEGNVLAFCKSGTRSTFLWALARSERGADADALIAKAAAAGYDLAPIAAYLN